MQQLDHLHQPDPPQIPCKTYVSTQTHCRPSRKACSHDNLIFAKPNRDVTFGSSICWSVHSSPSHVCDRIAKSGTLSLLRNSWTLRVDALINRILDLFRCPHCCHNGLDLERDNFWILRYIARMRVKALSPNCSGVQRPSFVRSRMHNRAASLPCEADVKRKQSSAFSNGNGVSSTVP